MVLPVEATEGEALLGEAQDDAPSARRLRPLVALLGAAALACGAAVALRGGRSAVARGAQAVGLSEEAWTPHFFGTYEDYSRVCVGGSALGHLCCSDGREHTRCRDSASGVDTIQGYSALCIGKRQMVSHTNV